jgi:hypothetical protein
LFSRPARRPSFLGRGQLYTGTTRFGQSDGDGLFGRAGAVFTFANVFHFLADKFASLSRRRFTFPSIFACPFDCFFFWHGTKGYADKSFIGCQNLRCTIDRAAEFRAARSELTTRK